VTHPAHPLRGQLLPVIQQHRKEDGRHLIEVQLDNDELRLIPQEWTDQSQSATAWPGTRFVLAHLCHLRQRLDTLLPVPSESEILAHLTEISNKGERDEHTEPTQVDQADGGPACTDSRHSGANGPAPTGRVSGG